jgi:hypothetical protein
VGHPNRNYSMHLAVVIAVVRTDASSRRSGRLVSSLRMFSSDLHLASSQHSDIAGFPLEWHQRIQGLPHHGKPTVVDRQHEISCHHFWQLRDQFGRHAMIFRFIVTATRQLCL